MAELTLLSLTAKERKFPESVVFPTVSAQYKFMNLLYVPP